MDFTPELIERTYLIQACPRCNKPAKIELNKQDVGGKEPREIEVLSISCPECGDFMSVENYTIDIADIFNLVSKWNNHIKRNIF